MGIPSIIPAILAETAKDHYPYLSVPLDLYYFGGIEDNP
jgi:hypothetical protein